MPAESTGDCGIICMNDQPAVGEVCMPSPEGKEHCVHLEVVYIFVPVVAGDFLGEGLLPVHQVIFVELVCEVCVLSFCAGGACP